MDFRGFFNKIKNQIQPNSSEELPVGGSDPNEISSTPPPATRQTTPRPVASAPGGGAGNAGILGLQSRDPSGTGGARNKAGVVQNEKDDSQYNQRSEHVARIEAMFGEFGPAACSYVLAQSLIDGGIKRLLQKLELTSRGRDGADLAQVENWILRNGVPQFCAKVGIRQSGTAAAPAPPVAPPPLAVGRVTVRPLDPNRVGAPSDSQENHGGFGVAARPRSAGGPAADGQSPGAPAGPPGTHLQRISVRPINLTGTGAVAVNMKFANIPSTPPDPPSGVEIPVVPYAENKSVDDLLRLAAEDESGRH